MLVLRAVLYVVALAKRGGEYCVYLQILVIDLHTFVIQKSYDVPVVRETRRDRLLQMRNYWYNKQRQLTNKYHRHLFLLLSTSNRATDPCYYTITTATKS